MSRNIRKKANDDGEARRSVVEINNFLSAYMQASFFSRNESKASLLLLLQFLCSLLLSRIELISFAVFALTFIGVSAATAFNVGFDIWNADAREMGRGGGREEGSGGGREEGNERAPRDCLGTSEKALPLCCSNAAVDTFDVIPSTAAGGATAARDDVDDEDIRD